MPPERMENHERLDLWTIEEDGQSGSEYVGSENTEGDED